MHQGCMRYLWRGGDGMGVAAAVGPLGCAAERKQSWSATNQHRSHLPVSKQQAKFKQPECSGEQQMRLHTEV